MYTFKYEFILNKCVYPTKISLNIQDFHTSKLVNCIIFYLLEFYVRVNENTFKH